ncbi:TIGR03936 family radical SAM-associated protein [Fervidobacterium islandicum]|uniref:TIGR03936 family radical SAM-associated protein n=1 Tax=Fervidobacterium islandicum TaxID=2423 RepID=A0AAI8CIM7_FERIS|nr:TIGR03936 family radical SAM-associated protein [Fervidobacterium islandicum]AMW32189.1 TIGR03936 family radical SAM-associated protein [Fervidobacterium islandicum]
MILLFKKKGLLRFLSAIETSNAIVRTLLRSGMKIQYSEGFHPKPRVSFLDTVATGVVDLALYVNVKLEHEASDLDIESWKGIIRNVAVQGLELVEIFPSDINLNEIVTSYEYLLFSREPLDLNRPVQKHSGKLFIPAEMMNRYELILKNGLYVVKYTIERQKIFNPYLIDGVFLAVRTKAFYGTVELREFLTKNGGKIP